MDRIGKGKMKVINEAEKVHKPVLDREVIRLLDLKKAHLKGEAKVIDATVGTGGHLAAFLEYRINVLGIDADLTMLEMARKRLEKLQATSPRKYPGSFILVHENYSHLSKVAKEQGFFEIDAVLFDLGVSSLQLTAKERGFSFQNPKAILDMRLDAKTSKLTAADLLNLLSLKQLSSLFLLIFKKETSFKLAKEIVKKRKKKKFATVGDLLEIVSSVIGTKVKLHPATKVFLALRIAVNSELEVLKEALPEAFSLLKRKGRLAVISFHSGEDRIVKEYFNNLVYFHKGRKINKKPIIPRRDEVEKNYYSRSAKLRVIEKI